MIPLSANNIDIIGEPLYRDIPIFKLSRNDLLPKALRPGMGYIVTKPGPLPPGFTVYLGFRETLPLTLADIPTGSTGVILGQEHTYLNEGDVVRINHDRRALRVLYRRDSPHNTFLLTERCNNYCLMCSQPPRRVDDSWIVLEVLHTIPMIDPQTRELGFSGGEPTLLGDGLIEILQNCKSYLPRTALHILSNGRKFSDRAYARKIAQINHPDLMIGIPLYSDLSSVHNYVVQGSNAFDETIRGILNLKRFRQKVELRVVMHKQTYHRLPQLADFIARNLVFLDHVTFMGLEMMGFTKANLNDLWIDPLDYQKELRNAVLRLHSLGMAVSIYNHQLCLLDKELWPFARKSISDWKNRYMPECEGCTERENCGGFFESATLRYSDNIKPFVRN